MKTKIISFEIPEHISTGAFLEFVAVSCHSYQYDMDDENDLEFYADMLDWITATVQNNPEWNTFCELKSCLNL
jgi:hypothetical protein